MATKRDALVASAEKSLQKGKADSALKDYLKVLEETPGDINILNKVGDLFVRLNRNEESIPYFTRIAEHYSRDGFFLKAIAIYKKINKLDPARLDIYERLAELYAKQGLTIEAKSQYQVLADYHAKNENVIGAIGIYQKMVQTEPQNIQLHVKLADLYTQARRTGEALKEYGVVASLLRERGASDEAVQVYEKALRIGPDNGEILGSFVPMLLQSGRLAEARAHLAKALETTPRSVPLFLLAAEAALAAGDKEEAKAFVGKAQAVEPDSEEVLAAAVKVHPAAGASPQAMAAAIALADRAMRRGEAKKALTLLEPFAETSKENEDFLAKLVQIAEAANGPTAGIPYRSLLADLWKSKGRVSDAADALRVLTRLAPDRVEFRARLAALEPPAPAAPRVDRSGSVSRPIVPPAVEPPAAAPPAAPPHELGFEISGQIPAVEAAPAPAPAPPGADDAFILEFDDEQLVRDPGSTGPMPSAIRRISQRDVPAFVPPAPRVPPPPAFGVLQEIPAGDGLEARAGYDFKDHHPAALPIEPAAVLPPPTFTPEEVQEIEEAVEVMDAEAPPPATPAAVLPEAAPPAEPPPAPAPKPPLTQAATDTKLAEAEVFRKYGLLDKAIELLRATLISHQDALPLREKLFEVCLEAGKKSAAIKEAERLKERYRADGRDDRVKALDALLVERTSQTMGEALDDSVPGAFVDTTPGARPSRKKPAPAAAPEPPAPAEAVAEVAPPAEPTEAPAEPTPPAAPPPTAEELAEVDFCLEQGMVVDAAERLQALEREHPGDPMLAERRQRLEGKSAPEEARPDLGALLTDDFESVLDAELGRALTDEMARGSAAAGAGPVTPMPPASALNVDESGLFSDEQEFFNFAGDLQAELKQEATGSIDQPEVPTGIGQDVPLEEIFREFKKGVEQQLSPEDYETHYNLGIAYKEMALVDEAIGEFQRAAKSPQHAVECCSMLGLCFLEKGLPQLAIKWYRKGLDAPNIREEDRLGLQYDLANVYLDVGERDSAYRTFLEIYGSNANFRDVGDRIRDLSTAGS